MVLTRAQNQPGPDGILGTADDIQDANNTDSPWVDQSQTYTSHPSHQVFLREYADRRRAQSHPVSTGKLLGGLARRPRPTPASPDGRNGMSTWASVKKQAAEQLGLRLRRHGRDEHPDDRRRPVRQLHPRPPRPAAVRDRHRASSRATSTSPCRCRPTSLHFDTPFLTDIAHNADPSPQDTDNNPARRRWPRRRTPTHPVGRLRAPAGRAPTTTRC